MAKLPAVLTYNDLNGSEAVEILADWLRQLLQSHPQFQPHLTLPMARFTLDVRVGVDMFIGGTQPVASPPEHFDVQGSTRLENAIAGAQPAAPAPAPASEVRELRAVVNAAPIPGGEPPDQIRDKHGLPVSRPGYGPRETGSHIFLADIVEQTLKTAGQPPSQARQGMVAEGYSFAPEMPPPPAAQVLEQHIPVDRGAIDISMTGDGLQHAGVHVSAGTHIASKKEFGDQAGHSYGSVSGVLDAGPAGLQQRNLRGGGGLGSDGRTRLSFGNSHRG